MVNKAEMQKENQWVEVDLQDFERHIKGFERNKKTWPPLRCVSCQTPVSAPGLVSPTPDFTARFTHHDLPKGETCPLGSNSTRFKGLTDNEKSVDAALADQRRASFVQFRELSQAYLICREMLGGRGKLQQDRFLHMLKVADSFGIWNYSYLPAWGIPLLLMLMDNHPTPNGKACFFYILKKDKAHSGTPWHERNIRLEAHWVSNGSTIVAKAEKYPAFRLTIPFTQETVKAILADVGNIDFYTEEKLKKLNDFCRQQHVVDK